LKVIDEPGGQEYNLTPLTDEEKEAQLARRERFTKKADAEDPERLRRARKVIQAAHEKVVERGRKEGWTPEGPVGVRAPSEEQRQPPNQAQAEVVVGDPRGPTEQELVMATGTTKGRDGTTTHRCTTCGKRFPGTGKRGRPNKRCPEHRK
jgi:hypothetical protein